ncbi:MAG TPA: two-component regulator propeller domain-containing protein [Saprospiraceae bacterium]|nr:two-component regulator propeller domain-containing protein [Saprospiraceae bacterium]
MEYSHAYFYVVTITGMLIFGTSCHGHSQNMPSPEVYLKPMIELPDTSIGEIVEELSNNLMLVYQDKKHNYWFGSWGEGLYKYDGKKIIRFTIADGLASNRIDEIREDKAGHVYFNTPGGISRYDGNAFTTLKMSAQSTNEWKLGPDDLWFKCMQDSGQVYRYDGQTLHRLSFPEIQIGKEYDALFPPAQYTNRSNPYDVYTIYTDSRGNIWFGTAVFGVCRFDGKSLNWITEKDLTEIHDGPANGIRSITEDMDGYFWFSNSLFRYDIYNNTPGKGKVDRQDRNAFVYSREKGVGSLDEGKYGGDVVEYMSATKDNSGALWIVTYGAGVYRYNGKDITHFPIMAGKEFMTLFSIFKDRQGVLWVGTHENGVYRFNGQSFERFRP